jgi:hypothetical protein
MGTPATPIKKVGWLKKFGQGVVKVLKTGVSVSEKIEQAVEKPVEAVLPVTIPIFNVLDAGYEVVKTVEATFAALGQADNDTAKEAAAIEGISTLVDEWIEAKLPGYTKLVDAAAWEQQKAGLVNWIVKTLNMVADVEEANPATANALAAASAAVTAANAEAAKITNEQK